jgi:CubicO group peptidase (beta-lactamase class C family)
MKALPAIAFLLLGSLAAGLAPARAEGGASFEKRWKVVIHRPNWDPPEATAILVLEKRAKAWRGTITFEILMKGQRQECIDLRIDGPKIEFMLADLGYSFKGEMKDEGLAGTCETTRGQIFEWTAGVEKVVPVDLFEPGLAARGGMPQGDAKGMGMDLPALYDLVRAAEASDTDALVVVRGGRVVCERTFGREDGPIQLMSVTKFVTAFAVGILLQEKRIPDLDAPLSTWFTGWKEGPKGTVTLRHLLTHTSGIVHGVTAEALNAEPDKVAYVSKAEVKSPGTEWSYNNEAVALLSGVISKAAGKPCDAFLRATLFDPLGIRDWKWDRDEAMHTVTYAQLRMTARDLARLGQLVVDGGRIPGVGKAPAKEILDDHTLGLLGGEATPLRKSQGLLWMRILQGSEPVGVRHDGWLGQHVVVYPKDRLVGVRLRRGSKEKGDATEFDMPDFPAKLRACLKN